MPGGWERLASHEGGTVVALATARSGSGDRETLFAATAAGLFCSEDGGQRWSPGGETPLPLLAVIAPSSRFAENRLLFAGTQTGCYRSTDAGRTWQQTLSGGRIFAMAVVPGIGSDERVFAGTQRDGILRSDDGGRTWTGANPGLLDLTVLALAFSPDAARDLTGFAATTSGLYRTRNGGKSWREVEWPLDEPAVQCVAISPTYPHDRLILAGTESDGLWRSDDGGATWDRVPGLPAGGIGAIAFSPYGAVLRLIAVATDRGVALSHDGGATWHLTGEALPPVLALAFVPEGDGETLVAGLYRDGAARLPIAARGVRWIPATAGLRATFLTTLIASPTFDDNRDRTLVVAGPEAGLRISRDGGHSWSIAGGDLTDAAVYGVALSSDSHGDRRIVAATDAGVYCSRDGGMYWDPPAPEAESATGIVVAGMAAENGLSPLFAATLDGHLIASDDGGTRWRALNTPDDNGTVVALACSPSYARNRTLYAGTVRPAQAPGVAARTVWRSTDGGNRWVRWMEEQSNGMILPLAVALDQRGNGDDALFVGRAGGVWQPRRNAWERQGGTRVPLWHGVSLATQNGDPISITALAVSPHYRADGIVLAATSDGVYRSRSRGHSFDRWSENVTPTGVLALAMTTTANDATPDGPLLVFALGVDGTIWRRTDDA
jgi:photosystem II stability/assembly factor-like uncharacterized protein